EHRLETAQLAVRVLQPLAPEDQVERGPRGRDDLAVAVEDDAAHGRHGDPPQPVVLGERGVLVPVDDLQVVEAEEIDEEEQDHPGMEERHPAAEPLAVEVVLELPALPVVHRRFQGRPSTGFWPVFLPLPRLKMAKTTTVSKPPDRARSPIS